MYFPTQPADTTPAVVISPMVLPLRSSFLLNSTLLRKRRLGSRAVPVPLLAPLVLVLSLLSTQAQIVVNSTGDEDRFPYQQPICDTDAFDNVTVCTLRAAIETANLGPDVAIITFNIPTTDPGYNAQTHSWTITLGLRQRPPLPDISTDISIAGPGAAKLFISGGSVGRDAGVRVFNVTAGGTVSFSGITIANGLPPDAESAGGIQNVNGGTVNVTNCVLSDNGSGKGSWFLAVLRYSTGLPAL